MALAVQRRARRPGWLAGGAGVAGRDAARPTVGARHAGARSTARRGVAGRRAPNELLRDLPLLGQRGLRACVP